MYLFKKPPLLLCVTEINQAAATFSTQEVQELEAAQRTNERMNGRTFSMSHCANLLIDRTASNRSEETTKRKGFLSVDRSINNISSTNLFPYKSSLIEGLLFFFGFFLGLFQDFANKKCKIEEQVHSLSLLKIPQVIDLPLKKSNSIECVYLHQG